MLHGPKQTKPKVKILQHATMTDTRPTRFKPCEAYQKSTLPVSQGPTQTYSEQCQKRNRDQVKLQRALNQNSFFLKKP